MLDYFYSGDKVYNVPGWADETVDSTVRWNRVNRHFNFIDLATGNLWNGHRLECGFNQSAFRIRPTCCITCITCLMLSSERKHSSCIPWFSRIYFSWSFNRTLIKKCPSSKQFSTIMDEDTNECFFFSLWIAKILCIHSAVIMTFKLIYKTS
jgi:hypothetical protein